MNAAIELGNLVKEYETPAGVIKALDHLDLIVPERGIFGLLGLTVLENQQRSK